MELNMKGLLLEAKGCMLVRDNNYHIVITDKRYSEVDNVVVEQWGCEETARSRLERWESLLKISPPTIITDIFTEETFYCNE